MEGQRNKGARNRRVQIFPAVEKDKQGSYAVEEDSLVAIMRQYSFDESEVCHINKLGVML